jgi:hypothetical protein
MTSFIWSWFSHQLTFFFVYYVCVLLRLELRAYTVNHSSSLFCDVFEIGSCELFAELASNLNSLDL